MGYSKEERETVLVYSDETRDWSVYSNVPKHIRKLESLCELTVLESEDGRPIAIKGTLTEKQVSMKKERVMTDEQREKLANIMKKVRSNQD